MQGVAPETIVATTFTRKAAGEILQRLMSDLSSAADPDNPAALDALRQKVGVEDLPRSVARDQLKRLIASIHRFRVTTIDGLFFQLARAMAFELNLPAGWRMSDDVEEGWLRSRAVAAVTDSLDADETRSLLSMLSGGQLRRSVVDAFGNVVKTADEPTRDVPPDGWTRLQCPRSPDDAALNRAAASLDAARRTIGDKRIEKILAAVVELLEMPDRGGIAGHSMTAKIAAGGPLTYWKKPIDDSLDPGVPAALQTLLGIARTETLGELRAKNEATGRLLDDFRLAMNAVRAESAAVSFGELAHRLSSRMDAVDARQIATSLGGGVDHVLLDEFQDTSPVQWSVLLPMARRAADRDAASAEATDGMIARSFFCVGDTKQAIYGWRGGVAEIFDEVSESLGGLDEDRMVESYRSSPVVIDAVNRVFANLTSHPAADPKDHRGPRGAVAESLRHFADTFPTHVAVRDSPGRFELATTAAPTPGENGRVDADGKRDALLDAAAARVRDLHTADADRTIGVLFRGNDTRAAFEHRLRSIGLPFAGVGGSPLTDSPAVRLVMSSLAAAEFPGDGRYALHLSNTPLRTDGDWTPDAVRRLLTDDGLASTVRRLSAAAATVAEPTEVERLRQLCQAAIEHERNETPRTVDFINRVEVQRYERSRPAAIRCLTIHQSKGLEFDTVVLPEMHKPLTRTDADQLIRLSDSPTKPATGVSRYLKQDLWPLLPEAWRAAAEAGVRSSTTEALCLMYVAMTRARSELVVLVPPEKKLIASSPTPAGLIAAALGVEKTDIPNSTLLALPSL